MRRDWTIISVALLFILLASILVPVFNDEGGTEIPAIPGAEWDAVIQGYNHLPYILVAAADSSTESRNAAWAVGDGTQDYVQVQAALDTGRPVLMAEGTYDMDGVLSYQASDVWLEGMGPNTILDFRDSGTNYLIKIYGSVSGTNTTLASDASVGDIDIAATSTANFSAGDWIRVRSAAWFNNGSDTRMGEIRKIASIASGTITLDSSLAFDYATGDTATIDLVVMRENVTLKNFKVLSETTDNFYGVWIEECANVTLDGLVIDSVSDRAINAQNVVGLTMTNCDLTRANRTALGYGIAAANASRDFTISNNHFTDCRHAFAPVGNATYGAQTNLVFSNNTVEYNSQSAGAVGAHNTYDGLIVKGNTVINDGLGYFAGKNSVITSNYNHVTSCSNGGIYLTSYARGCTVSDNDIIAVGVHGIQIRGKDGTVTGNYVYVDDTSYTNGIYLYNDVDDWTISNNTIVTNHANSDAIYVKAENPATSLTNLNIISNIINSSRMGINLTVYGKDIEHVSINNNNIEPTTYGIYVSKSSGNGVHKSYSINGNNIGSATTAGIFVSNSSTISINNNVLSGGGTAGIQIANSGSGVAAYQIMTNNISGYTTKIVDAENAGIIRDNMGYNIGASGTPSGTTGANYYNSVANVESVYDGTSWQPLW